MNPWLLGTIILLAITLGVCIRELAELATRGVIENQPPYDQAADE